MPRLHRSGRRASRPRQARRPARRGLAPGEPDLDSRRDNERLALQRDRVQERRRGPVEPGYRCATRRGRAVLGAERRMAGEGRVRAGLREIVRRLDGGHSRDVGRPARSRFGTVHDGGGTGRTCRGADPSVRPVGIGAHQGGGLPAGPALRSRLRLRRDGA